MKEVVILIPDLGTEQNIEIDVRINGRKKTMQYRVELVQWEGSKDKPTDRFTTIKHHIDHYDKSWELVEIGTPDNKNKIPLMFRKKRTSSNN